MMLRRINIISLHQEVRYHHILTKYDCLFKLSFSSRYGYFNDIFNEILWFNTPRDKDISWILDDRRQTFYDCVKAPEK